MSDLFWLSEAQMRRIEPYFPLSHGVPRVDDCRGVGGIISAIRLEYSSHKTIYNRFVRWRRTGVFNHVFVALAAEDGPPEPA